MLVFWFFVTMLSTHMLDQALSVAVPSIVVHNGSNSAPGSPTMERNFRAQRTLSKQVDIKQLLKIAML